MCLFSITLRAITAVLNKLRLLTYIFIIHSHFNGMSLHCGHVHHVVSKHYHLGIPVIVQLKYLLG